MVAVIGDVHGCYNTLKALVQKIRVQYPDITIYCVGDLVDRGNLSAQVIDFIIAEKIFCALGNHDYMFYCNMRDPFSLMARSWSYNGAETTLISYRERTDIMDEHLDFISSLPLFYNLDDCFISHAGISAKYKTYIPDGIKDEKELTELLKKDLDNQDSILWTRGNLLNIGKLQIVGHTHKKELHHDLASNTMYIDTTAYGNNKLTAVIIQDNKCIKIIEEKSDIDDVNKNWIYQF
ncbi:MAG: metallophosphoesterase [Ignavibacteriaceae bacterium]|jgi:serine/threonine protein phosphatase 1|nr:metallophosphoesterase [Ignavibacteriaceae bacterium]